jgi:hypothetical protein
MFLERLEVSTPDPCTQSWEAMRGDLRHRHCAECAKTVHNLASLTRREVELLAMRAVAGEEVCSRITRDVDGELVMKADPKHSHLSRSVVLSAALMAGLPAAAQSASVAPKADAAAAGQSAGVARVTGRLLKPDGSPVDTGLIYVAPEGAAGQFYVVDSIGMFEFRVPPGTYDFAVQTGPGEAQRIRTALLHEGEQSFGDVKTQAGRDDLTMTAEYTTGGAMTSRISWSWRGRLRHPVLYARSLVRKLS